MTTQEAYEAIREFFSRPEATLAWDEGLGECVYRGGGEPDSPIRCAFGCILPDDLYSPNMEGTSVIILKDSEPGSMWKPVLRHFEGVNLKFLERAQHAHDSLAQETARCDRDGEEYSFKRTPTQELVRQLDLCAGYEGLKVVKP